MSQTSAPRTYRILSFDGGPSTVDYLRQLRVIEHNRPGFLDRVDFFAGTSDGAWSALFLASRPAGTSGIDAIDQAIAFNRRVVESLELGIFGLWRLATGGWSAIGNKKLLRELRRAFGNGPDGTPIKMRDVGRDTCAVSFHLGGQPKKPGGKVFHNLVRAHERPSHGGDLLGFDDLDLEVAEVALRSGSFPILMPVRAGYADGGLFANNPAMAAVAQAIEFRNELGLTGLPDITLFSCGADDAALGGCRARHQIAKGEDMDWGWIPWLMLPWAPLVLVDAVVTASGRGISNQCRQLLGPRFIRLGPQMSATFGQQVLRLIEGRFQKLYDEANARVAAWAAGEDGIEYRPSLAWTLEWIDREWMKD